MHYVSLVQRHRLLRTASEHVFAPVRLPLSRINVLNTNIAPVLNVSWSLVIHMKTMHSFTTPATSAQVSRGLPPLELPAISSAR